MTDYSKALWIPNNNYFADSGPKRIIVIHATAGGSNAEEIAAYFQSTEGGSSPVSSHYIDDVNGTIVQTVLEKNGAWANGVVTNPAFAGENPNDYTISIEHVKSTLDNSALLTNAQAQASFELIADICKRNNIVPSKNTIIPHSAIYNTKCPGPYPWDSLFQFLSEENKPMPPTSNQLSEALNCWDSVFRTINQIPPQTGTGIYQSWLSDWINGGKQYGPPLTHEYHSNDWEGNPIVCQEFAHARCEWKNGVPNWYGPGGKI